ncbi:MAG TPA: hypothetical protein VGJ28_15410 [Micromonosporaceae bacterium]
MPPEAIPDAGVIELGSDFEPVAPKRRRRKREWDSLGLRRARWAVPVIVVLVFVTGSVLPNRLPLSLAANVDIGTDASVLVAGGEAILLDVRDGAGHVSAYDLGGSGLIWSQITHLPTADSGVRVVSDTVVVSTAYPAPNGVATEAFALSDGRPLWRSGQSVAAIDVHNDLVTDLNHPDGTETLQQVRPVTGRVGWTLRVAAGCTTIFGNGASDLADRLVEMCLPAPQPGRMPVDHPTLRSVDLTSGMVTATRDLTYDSSAADILVPPDQRMRAPEVTIIGNLTLLLHNGFPPAVDAFNAESLQSEWSGTPAAIGDTVTRCGGLICLVDGDRTSAIDPGSGSLVPDIDLSITRRLVAEPVGSAGAVPVPVVNSGINVEVPQPSAGSVWIGEQSTSSLLVRRLQPINGVSPKSCYTSGHYLVCATTPARLTFWRLPG